MKYLLAIGAAAAVAACLMLAGCGGSTGPGGKKIQPKPPATSTIDPPDKKANEGLAGKPKTGS